MDLSWDVITVILGFIGTGFITLGSLVWWLAGQFTGVRNSSLY